MKLVIKRQDLEKIESFLFQDSFESMIIGSCVRLNWHLYKIDYLFFPEIDDYVKRTTGSVTLKAEKAYHILQKIRQSKNLSFVQIHSHVNGKRAEFSLTDNLQNSFNLEDLKGFNKRSRFFRILFTREKNIAQYYSRLLRRFRRLHLIVE